MTKAELLALANRCEAAMAEKQRELLERFLQNVAISETCWNWTGRLRGSDPTQARGSFWADGRHVSAPRWIYQHFNPTAEMAGLFVLHSCDNPKCVNPNHLSLGTQADNVADMWNKGRAHQQSRPEIIKGVVDRLNEMLREKPSLRPHGERSQHARLTAKQVKSIAASSEKTKVLAERFGVNRTTIQRIRSGHTWKLTVSPTAILRARAEEIE